MSVNSISSIYSSLYSRLASKSTGSEDKTTNSSGESSISDILELCSSEEDLSSYLNYDSSGKYSKLSSTLLDYISADDDGTSLSKNSKSLASLLYSNSNDDTAANIFDCLINANAAKVENLIEIAQEKLDTEESVSE